MLLKITKFALIALLVATVAVALLAMVWDANFLRLFGVLSN